MSASCGAVIVALPVMGLAVSVNGTTMAAITPGPPGPWMCAALAADVRLR